MGMFGSPVLTVLTLLQVLFLVAMGVIAISGLDRGGELPGVVRLIWFVASGLLWALLFGVAVVISMVQRRHWTFLGVTAVLLAARILFLWYEEAYGGGAEDHIYVWFPVEGFVYLLWKYPVALGYRVFFLAANLGLYGGQFALVFRWFI